MLIKIHLTFPIVSQEIPFSGDSHDMEINQLICRKKKNQLTGFYMVRIFAGRYFRTGFNKQPYSIANYYLLTCIIKHSLSSWGVFLNNITLRVLINAKHKKCGNYLCEFVLSSQTQVPYFSSHGSSCSQFLCRILFNFWIICNL